jgi:LPS export ABC transporter protein LptC/lipopolysaccharide transport protein LptA
MARKPRTFVSTFRKLLLLALVLTVVAVAGLFWFGRAGQQQPRRAVEEEEARQARQGTTLIGEDFDYTFTEREKPIFRIRGESVRADAKGVVYLNEVGVTIYDKQGRPYHVESRKASFHRETNQGLLQGNVFLRGPDGLELRTARLDLKRKGQLLVAPREPVEIRYGGKYIVTSSRLEVDLPQDTYVLQGGVRVRTVPGAPGEPASLRSQRLVYERPQRWLRVEGDSELRKGSDWLNARRITARLTPDETGLHFVRAFWGVTGQTRARMEDPAGSGGQPTVVRFSGRDLAAVLEPEGNEIRRMDLDAENKGKAVIESTGGGLTRTMRASRFEGLLAQGVLTSAQAFGGVEIREVARGRRAEGTREAEGKRAEAAFRPDGQLASVELINDVLYRDPQVTANGTRGSLDLEAGLGEFMGNPVTITSERGRVRAPRVVYNTDTEIVQARGGVRATLERVSETALAGTPLGEGDGPVMVESQEAFWKQEPSSFIFRGDVRAWRGENLLLAPELRGDRTQETLVATGGVKTRWIPDSDVDLGAEPKPAAKPKAGSTQASRAPIEVAASEMTYRQGSGVLIYTGNVRVNQEAKTLTCQNLQVELEEEAAGQKDDREVETMTCTGDAKLNDPQAGRKAEGQTAVYRVAERRVEMTGDPVTLLDREGNVLRGRRLFYYIDDGRVEMKGAREQAAPAPAASGGSR